MHPLSLKFQSSHLLRFNLLLILSMSSILLTACQTTTQKTRSELYQQLNQYIGKDFQQLQQNFNLDQMGLKINPNPIITSERAIFSFDRIGTTAIPSTIITRDSNGVIIPVQIASVSNSYNYTVSCNIIFALQKNIVQSVLLQGKAC